MKVVILCGGMGTRLREETEFKPKPLVTIGEKPILWHIMKNYSHYGFNDFILCLGWKGDMIKEYVKNHDWDKEWDITMVDTGLNTKTAGRLKLVEGYLQDETFMLTYGDGVADMNIPKLLKYHKDMGKIGTITGVRPFSKYGVVKIENGLVTEFKEKPILDDWINGGYMVFNRKIFDHIQLDDDCMLVEKTLPDLSFLKELAIYQHYGFWHCMDTYKEFTDLNKIWDSGKCPWEIWKYD